MSPFLAPLYVGLSHPLGLPSTRPSANPPTRSSILQGSEKESLASFDLVKIVSLDECYVHGCYVECVVFGLVVVISVVGFLCGVSLLFRW